MADAAAHVEPASLDLEPPFNTGHTKLRPDFDKRKKPKKMDQK